MKRLFDIVLSAVGLVVVLPIMGIIALLIMRSSPGGALFIQERVGRHEKLFKCYKFRTMTVGAPQAGSHEVADSWGTSIGRKLRSTKLDELPQLYNVLRGEMSLVGPRPCLPSQREVIEARRRKGVFSVRPGITGQAQLARIDMSKPNDLAHADRLYLDTRSLRKDILILVKTAFSGLGKQDTVLG